MSEWRDTSNRLSPWVLVNKDPEILIREERPIVHPARTCKRYDRIYHPMKVEYEGACRNYKYWKLECVYCTAHLMSTAAHGIPFDARFECDKLMGW